MKCVKNVNLSPRKGEHKIKAKLRKTTPIILESLGNYTKITYSNGEIHVYGYCQAELSRRFGIQLKRVSRGVSVDETKSKIDKKGVSIMNRYFEFSRRKKQSWLLLFFLATFFTSLGQNIAPVAVNDTTKACNDVNLRRVNVIANDYDPNQDKIRLTYITQSTPVSDILTIAETNTGMVRLENILGKTGTYQFQYSTKDLRFANIGSLASNTGVFVFSLSSPYTYTGAYAGNNIREACRSTTSGTVNITGHEKITVYEYAEFLPGTVIDASGGGVYEAKVK